MTVKETGRPGRSEILLDSHGFPHVARYSFNMLVKAIGYVAVQMFEQFS